MSAINQDYYVYHSYNGKTWKLQPGGPYQESDFDKLKQVEGERISKYWNTRREINKMTGHPSQLGYLIRVISVAAGTPPPEDLEPLSDAEIFRQEIDPSWKSGS